MRNIELSRRDLFNGFAAIAAVTAGILLVAELEAEASLPIPSAPDAIDVTSIDAPDVSIANELDELHGIEFVVPVLDRSELRLPALPAIDAERVRAEAASWLGDGVMAAPTATIEVEAPDLDAIDELSGPRLEVATLERPELPELPAIR